jgi:hypothetical protein
VEPLRRFNILAASSGIPVRKERHTFRPVEFFGDAVRVATHELFVPQRGFKRNDYHFPVAPLQRPKPPMPGFIVSVEQARILGLFMDLLGPLGDSDLSVILESSHESSSSIAHRDYYVGEHDAVVLHSLLLEHEELFRNDGMTGIAVFHEPSKHEVMLTEHKMLHCYGTPGTMGAFQRILHGHEVPHVADLKTILDVSHEHSTTPAYEREFHELLEHLSPTI